jgi:hypothetical protein
VDAVLMRGVNHRIHEIAATFGEEAVVEYCCECDWPTCRARIRTTRDVFERVRAIEAALLIAREHERAGMEPIEYGREYLIVQIDQAAD